MLYGGYHSVCMYHVVSSLLYSLIQYLVLPLLFDTDVITYDRMAFTRDYDWYYIVSL